MNMEAAHVGTVPQELAESSDKDCGENKTYRSNQSKEASLPENSFQCDNLQISRSGCTNHQTDLEARKSCEERWLQLFQLVERQCQEQIDAQQEQFNHQLQLIRDEIKQLAHLQAGSSPQSYGPGNAVLPVTYDTHSLKPQDDQRTQDEERGMNSSNPLHLFRELDIHQRAFITQEHFLENTSVSSGYGTHSASEPSACLSSCIQNTSREKRLPAKQILKECNTESIRPHYLQHVPVESEKPFKLLSGARCHLISTEGHSSEHSESNLNCDKNTTFNSNSANRSLTTWAQKIRKTHCKKTTKMDQIPTLSTHLRSPSEQDLEYTDASSNAFYLNNRTESANSLFSGGSGFTYWMMDEKEMYHPLPENFETGLQKLFSPKESKELRIPSLTDIYHQKQRDREQCPAWEPLSPSEHTHPPEVLTLDPTLHRKPLHNALLSKPVTHCSESYTAPVTPDSILENPSYNHDDEETTSNASSLLGDSSNRSPLCLAVGDKHWKSTRYKVKKNIDYQLCHGDACSDERMNCTEDEANSLASSPISQSPLPPTENNMPSTSGIYPMDHPVMLSNVRRSLREKHARHLADLRDYYESEISNLKQQLLGNNKSTSTQDLMKINSLTESCAQLEGALTEASKRIRVLENKNSELEIQLAEWRERYHTANGISTDLQEQIEEMRVRSKEKENAISRLQSKLKEIEESLQKSIRQSDDKETRIKQEHKMFQDLLLEYESLGKEHERVKDTLSITENTLCNAHSELNELRRTVSKLETQIRQLEHDNIGKFNHITEGQLWSSRPNNEVLYTSGNSCGVDVAPCKYLTSKAECSIFTGQPLDNKTKEMERKQDIMYAQNRYNSPPEKDAVHDILASKTEDSSSEESPILKALRDYEEEKELKIWSSFPNKDNSSNKLTSKRHLIGISDYCTPRGSPERSKERQRQPNSTCGPRSSSLPPSNRKSVNTPTKRELMLTPLSVKYSPKRSPSENLSPGLSQLLHVGENTVTSRFDVPGNSSTFKNPSPRKRLQFMSLEDPEGIIMATWRQTIINSENSCESQFPLLLPPFETEITFNERMKTISNTERLFDELSEEKKQIEAALSRMPGVGRRLSLKMRATKESLEDRLEKINRELGSIRMSLKKHHVLPTSANI
ncbi:M-phase phosphoprotein 9 isoform X3 [Hyla sarda]|uniref:M-phase phosphoprotein 9 isoform X3 n=1 Tax=Hyla sarda TaxID=327740 RepID=UPI0024C37A60|nr:M-phase phosphoprotein 9 isoform X3 [Hyla sarda]